MSTDNERIAERVRQDNPFEITKAVDFTDTQIDGTWVDWPAPGGFATFMQVASPMPRMVLGGKGTGRTHIMRHFSAPVQVIRSAGDPIAQAEMDRVVGIYVLCSGLDSSRFKGRGQSSTVWQSVFAQYADLWLAQAALEAFATITATSPPSIEVQQQITRDVRNILQGTTSCSGVSLDCLMEDLYKIQRSIDSAVNNAALNPEARLNFTFVSNPGDLTFGVPIALRRYYKSLENVTFLYLLDEFENFEEQQQEYVNTLIREKKPGTSFMVGVRTFGLRTLKTLGGGEENKRGSEFEAIEPDSSYRNPTSKGNTKDRFDEFCREVVARRLIESHFVDIASAESLRERLADFFLIPARNYEEQLIVDRFSGNDRPCLINLRENLIDNTGATPVPTETADIDYIVQATSVPSRPLLEKANTVIMYRAWAGGKDLMETAKIMVDTEPPVDNKGVIQPNDAQKRVLDYYGTDMRAQLCMEGHSDLWYAGIGEFITMADGLPRNLLVILKNIYRWALFFGEKPFQGEPISLEAQRRGVLEATEWFLSDARPLGGDGEDIIAATSKLGDLFRQSRFSHKPAECSVVSFSADLNKCSKRARQVIEIAGQRSLLIPVGRGQRHRSTGITEAKFYLNRLLSPRWDLPTARRGTFSLKPAEVNAIFDPNHDDQFQQVLRHRLRRMNVPFTRGAVQQGLQTSLGLDFSNE